MRRSSRRSTGTSTSRRPDRPSRDHSEVHRFRSKHSWSAGVDRPHVQTVLGGDLILSFGGLSPGGLGRGMPGGGALARDIAAQQGSRRGGLGLGTTAPSARSALGRALRYLIPYRGWIAIYLAFWLVSISFDSSVPP